ncbi:MAG: hypothetical protein IIV79_03910 [Clostridia bacterium]|nr:hypothetical protein [Clostridia bacterium]
MKKFFKMRIFLCWLVCIFGYWLTALLYPYNFYCQENYLPAASLVQLLLFAGITALLGSVLFLLMQGLNAVGKFIAMKKNLLLYFLYNLILCTGFAWGTDKLLNIIKIEPFGIYLLLGLIPAMLCSIIYSYHVSHR